MAILLSSITLIAVPKTGIDFKTFYGVAKLQAQHQDIYSQELQKAVVSVDEYGTWYYFHPPQELLIFRPLAYLPMRWAFFVWCLIDTAILVGSAFLLHRRYPDFPVVAALAVPFPLTLYIMGQDSSLILAGTVAAFLFFVRGNDMATGLILGAMLIKPQFAVPIVAVLCVRRWKVAAWFAIGSALFCLLSVWMVGVQGLREMVALGKLEDAYEMLNQNTNLRGLVYAVAGRQTALVLILSAVMVIWAALLKMERDKAFAVAVIVCQLVSFHGHMCDMLPLLVPMAVFWGEAKTFWITLAFGACFGLALALGGPQLELLAVPLVYWTGLLWSSNLLLD